MTMHMAVRPARSQLPTGETKLCGRFGRSSLTPNVREVCEVSPLMDVTPRIHDKASEASDLPLAQDPAILGMWQTNKLAAAIKWQGSAVLEWIDARTRCYQAGRRWSKRQCRITAGMDWELLRLTIHLGLNLHNRTSSIRAYFEMHREIDAVCAWIDRKKRQLTKGEEV